ncbi:hypothetical protein [Burkholderia sp. 22PA0106]|uniref:hypothetical protein n=1 Tax=Burkholderia sp. 22PA0106 TaxID=3237371 RepID=UPI0039C1A742
MTDRPSRRIGNPAVCIGFAVRGLDAIGSQFTLASRGIPAAMAGSNVTQQRSTHAHRLLASSALIALFYFQMHF